MTTWAGEDTLYGEADNDDLVGGQGADRLFGGDGHDVLVADHGQIVREVLPDGTLRINANGSVQRNVILEEAGAVSGMIPMDKTPLRTEDPDLAAKLLTADLIVLAGGYDADGAKRMQADTKAWETVAVLIDLEPSADDVLDGGAGDDVLFGQRGRDQLLGGDGDDTLFGDQASNVAAKATSLPYVFNRLRLTDGGAGATGFALAADGTLVYPQATLRPEELDLNTPFVFANLDRGLIPAATAAAVGVPVTDALPRTDGSELRVLATVIPDLTHHTDVLAFGDTLDGGAGADTIFGDGATVYSPVLSDLTTVDGRSEGDAAYDTRQRLARLMHTFRTLAIDFDHAQHTLNGLADPHDLRFGEDVIRGGDGADTIFGDEGLIVEDFVMGLPVTAEQFTAAALQRVNWFRDLEYLASDLDYVAFEAHFATLSAMIAAAPPTAAVQADPDHHDLYIGNDTIAGDGGDDTIYGDSAAIVRATVTGQRFASVQQDSALPDAAWKKAQERRLRAGRAAPQRIARTHPLGQQTVRPHAVGGRTGAGDVGLRVRTADRQRYRDGRRGERRAGRRLRGREHAGRAGLAGDGRPRRDRRRRHGVVEGRERVPQRLGAAGERHGLGRGLPARPLRPSRRDEAVGQHPGGGRCAGRRGGRRRPAGRPAVGGRRAAGGGAGRTAGPARQGLERDLPEPGGL